MKNSKLRCGPRVSCRSVTTFLIALCLPLALLSTAALGDEEGECQAAGGSLLVGEVVSPPSFQHGRFQKGVELSHTHLTLKSESDGNNYDVAMDNVFASGYRPHSSSVSAPLNSIEVGDKLSVCGIPFNGGIHWVHNNCGDTPTSNDPNGWVKKISTDGSAGPNLEDAQNYCSIFPKN
jgi:hypothetical protein